jgi:hypothetical protein
VTSSVLFKKHAHALKGAAAADPGDKAGNVALKLLPQFSSRFFIMNFCIIRILELLWDKNAGFFIRHRPDAFHRALDIFFGRSEHQFCSQHF